MSPSSPSYGYGAPPELMQLPEEVLLRVLAALPLPALVAFGRTCRTAARLVREPALWDAHARASGAATLPGYSAGAAHACLRSFQGLHALDLHDDADTMAEAVLVVIAHALDLPYLFAYSIVWAIDKHKRRTVFVGCVCMCLAGAAGRVDGPASAARQS